MLSQVITIFPYLDQHQGSGVADSVGGLANVNASDQAITAAATVQGSIAAVLDGLTSGTSAIYKPKDICQQTSQFTYLFLIG